MMTYPPSVRSNKLFDYRIRLWQSCTVAARANVSSSDRSELLLSLRFSYILGAACGWFYPLPVIILEYAFPSTEFLWLGSAVRYNSIGSPLLFEIWLACHVRIRQCWGPRNVRGLDCKSIYQVFNQETLGYVKC